MGEVRRFEPYYLSDQGNRHPAFMRDDPDGQWVALDDFDLEHQRRVEAEEALADCASLLDGIEPEVRGGYSPDGALAKARAHLAKWKE